MTRFRFLTAITLLLLARSSGAVERPVTPDDLRSTSSGSTTDTGVADDPISHGFEIRLPICSLVSAPPPTDCLGCQLDANGEPLGSYVLRNARPNVLWAEDVGIFGVNRSVCFRPTPSAPSSSSPDSLGAQATTRFLPDGLKSTVDDRKRGVTIVRIRGFVNNIVDSTVRGDLVIRNGAPMKMALQLYDGVEWFTVNEATYPASDRPVLRELETTVPGNSYVRLEVTMSDEHGDITTALVQDARLFGTECYADVNNPGMCL